MVHFFFVSLFIQFLQWCSTKKQKPHHEILQISAINWDSCQSILIVKGHYCSQCFFFTFNFLCPKSHQGTVSTDVFLQTKMAFQFHRGTQYRLKEHTFNTETSMLKA